MTDFLLRSFIEAAVFIILGGIGLWGMYLIGKKLLKDSGEIDRKVIKEAHKEAYEELIDAYWPKLNQMMREGFTVPNIVPDKIDKPETDIIRDQTLTRENHPEQYNPDGTLNKMEFPNRIILE